MAKLYYNKPMNSIIYSILSVYVFIVMGYLAKKSFKEKINDKTITLINVYFLQVFLTFWGLLLHPIDLRLIYAPTLYFFIVSIVIVIAAFGAKLLFDNKKEYSIATVAAIIGNTGNLGIPINIAIFGEQSIPYTTIINLVNVFVVYTIGVFYYSRGSFDTKTSLTNIIKLPILWAAIIAILLSVFQVPIYASMTMQLFLFGIYLYGTEIKEISKSLLAWVLTFKFIILPLVTFIVLINISLEPMIKGIVFIELLMPLAVANVNLASLYDCKPKLTTALVFVSSVLFLGIIFIGVKVLVFL